MVEADLAGTEEKVEQAVLHWVAAYPDTELYMGLECLSDGVFFLKVLATIPEFRLQEKVAMMSEHKGLNERARTLRTIVKSMNWHYQCELLRDVSDMTVDCFEASLGNKKELLRIVLLLVGLLLNNPKQAEALRTCLTTFPSQEAQLFDTLILCASSLGVSNQPTLEIEWKSRILQQLELTSTQLENIDKIKHELEAELNLERHLRIEKEQTISLLEQNLEELLRRIQEKEETEFEMKKEIEKLMVKSNITEETLERQEEIAKNRVQELINECFEMKCKFTAIEKKRNEVTELNLENEYLLNKIESLSLELKKAHETEKELSFKVEEEKKSKLNLEQQIEILNLELRSCKFKEIICKSKRIDDIRQSDLFTKEGESLSFFEDNVLELGQSWFERSIVEENSKENIDNNIITEKQPIKIHFNDKPNEIGVREKRSSQKVNKKEKEINILTECERREEFPNELKTEINLLLFVVEELQMEIEKQRNELFQWKQKEEYKMERQKIFRKRIDCMFDS